MSETYAENRNKFVKMMDNDSVLVMFAGKAPVRRGDQNYAFTPQRNFYYLTGINRPNIILVIMKRNNNAKTYLFIERADELKAKWNDAAITEQEAKEISGIENYQNLDEFYEFMPRILFGGVQKVYFDLENRYWDQPLTEDIIMANQVREKYPAILIENAAKNFVALRKIKQEYEVEKIKKAIDISNQAFEAMLKNTESGMYEYEIEAYIDYTIKKNGQKSTAFNTIAASGGNATVLHYGKNNAVTKDGDLILFDFGAEYNYYASDISRTFPVNGKFTERQKQLYNIVLSAQQKVMEAIKPGLPFKRLNEIVIEFYGEELVNIGLIKSKEEVSKYYYHGVSHYLGLETHDIGRGMEDILEPGMIFTVEPGLYIAEENIGIRIEDNVLVTEDGCENLSSQIVKTVEDIEKFMGGR